MATYLFDLGRLVVGLTLLVAGGAKLLSPGPMAVGLSQVYGFGDGRRHLLTITARGVAVVELLAAFLTVTRWRVDVGLALVMAIGAGIVVFAGTAVALKRRVPCGCFGESADRPIGLTNVLIGVGLVAGAALLLAAAPAGPPNEEAPGLLILTAVLAVVTMLIRHRARLAPPFARHFQSFTKLRGGMNASG